MAALRFSVVPRTMPAVAAARRLGITEARFHEIEQSLFERGFPKPDKDTGNFDMKALDAWLDRQSLLTDTTQARDATPDLIKERLESMRRGQR